MKRRLDAALVHRGLARSRNQAQEIISAKKVFVNGIVLEKASSQVADEVKIELIDFDDKDVSRGAKKLRYAISHLPEIDVKEKICLDIGAATGGFTQVLLEHKAKKVYAIDVGYGQLDWSLRTDPRVVIVERFNARHLTQSDIEELGDFLVADVSFISLTTLLPALIQVLKPEAQLLLMVKPQFELEKNEIGDGVVKDLALREKAVWKVITAAAEIGLHCDGVSYSGLPGPSGNKEFFIKLGKTNLGITKDIVKAEIERAGI